MDYNAESLKLHKAMAGKIEVASKVKIETKRDLSIAYTPGVAAPCLEIAGDKAKTYMYTSKGNMVAVVTDGSAVLGLGNIGPEASIPVMEGKCILFKRFGNVDAFPIAISSQDVEDIVKTVKLISPIFGGINLEDISAPRCFEVEARLKNELSIPVFHDDQHGTAVVTLAGILNALRLTGKALCKVKIVISGAGAAGIAMTKLLLKAGCNDIILVDSVGAIYKGRKNGMNHYKDIIAESTNKDLEKGSLKEVLANKDIFIGVSKGNLLNADDIRRMNRNPIIFAMANPLPEISPGEAAKGGAFMIATGRSDYPNQINNVLAFPGIFRGALDIRATDINDDMKCDAARALAECVKVPTPEKIIPGPFDPGVTDKVAEAVMNAAKRTGCCPK